ncbi:MAG: hypothetical protein GY800_08980 [Planctomycetes bacterium]|nr:hypothetical protein [Planctomycetota bacterium]
MNRSKRTFNPLMANSFRFEQAENTDLTYTGNWGPTIQPGTIATSEWTVESGTVTLTDEASTTTTTTVTISGQPGEAKIINKVTLSDGQIDERAVDLRIMSNKATAITNDYGMGT